MIRQREEAIVSWFLMWRDKSGTGTETLFTHDCIHVESQGPRYQGLPAIHHWFREWNTRGTVQA